jgi:hypothetical protein
MPHMKTKLYPIPANDVLWLLVQGAERLPLSITVFDALGSSCHSCELVPDQEYKASIAVDRLPAGAYYLQMKSGTQDCMKPFLVVH